MSNHTHYHPTGWGAGAGAPASAEPAALRPTGDLNVLEVIPLTSPDKIQSRLPITTAGNRTVHQSRQTIEQILTGSDQRLLMLVGPCSIHDEDSALVYAEKLNTLRKRVIDRIVLVMRVYFEKPRTTVGWKGLINDPYLNGSFDIEAGLIKARRLLLAITDMGLPAATETLEPITPQYIADLVTWSSIGARTTESQIHRQMASGLSMPVGFKNATNGNLKIAIDAMPAATHSHAVVGIDKHGHTAIIRTKGNPYCHLILRGGDAGPNFDADTVAKAVVQLHEAELNTSIMIDCSHANSNKQADRQPEVLQSVIGQRLAGNRHLVGCMIESNLDFGSQKFNAGIDDPTRLKQGLSITDPCLDWQRTEQVILDAYRQLDIVNG